MTGRGRPENPNKGKVVKVPIPPVVRQQLEGLAARGFKGTTVPMVVLALVGDRIEELMRDGIIPKE